MITEDTTDLDSQQSLELARHYAMLLDPVPSRILFALKTLRKNYIDLLITEEEISSPGSYASIRLIDRIPTFKVPIYFAAAELYPERFGNAEDDTTKALLKILGPGMFGNLLAMIYFMKRINKLTHDPIWEEVSQELLIDMELGYLLGNAIERIGPADGMLIGGLRHIALGTLMLRDAETFKRYRNTKKGMMDIAHEHTKYGCDHAQIAMYLLYLIGFWKTKGGHIERSPLTIAQSLRGNSPRMGSKDLELEAWSNTIYWIDRIKANIGDLNATKKEGIDENLYELLQKARGIMITGSSFQWMHRGSSEEDIEAMEEKRKSIHFADAKLSGKKVTIPGISQESLDELSPEDVEKLEQYASEYEKT